MPEEIIIRHAQLNDLEAFRALRLEALRNHPDAFGADYAETAVKDLAYWISRLTCDPVNDAIFFAESQKRVVGMTGIHRDPSPKDRHAALVWGVYVKPEARGQRISERLVRACLDWAKAKGDIVIVKLGVVTHNLPALRCYERCGFTAYGTDPKAIFYDGAYYDEYLMSLEI